MEPIFSNKSGEKEKIRIPPINDIVIIIKKVRLVAFIIKLFR